MPRVNKADQAVMETFEFEFSEAPEVNRNRRGKHHDRWVAARALCEKNPGNTLKVMEYKNQGSAYQTAKAINNGEHSVFKGDSGDWTAVARALPPFINDNDEEEDREGYGVWLTYTPHAED